MRSLSCPKTQGRHPRHAAVNDLVKRALASAKIPSQLEPLGICHMVGKRAYGATIVPWRSGGIVVWDATCLVLSHVPLATHEAGVLAN